MICPNCKNNSIPNWMVWIKGPFGRFTCSICSAVSQQRKSARYVVGSFSAGAISAGLGIYFSSWIVFVTVLLPTVAIDYQLLARFVDLRLVQGPRSCIVRYAWVPLAVVCAWAIYAFLIDETLDDGFEDFYFRERPEVAYAAIGLAGIDAPVGVDFMEYGWSKVKEIQNDIHSGDRTRSKREDASAIKFVGSPKEFDCWWDSSQKDRNDANCASEERVKFLLRENETLLYRYQLISELQVFQGWSSNGQLFIDLNKLMAAEVELDVRNTNYEVAYQAWRQNYQFISRVLGDENTWVDKAIFMVAESIGISSIEKLLRSYPGIADKHGDELLELLKPTGLARWNLPGIVRAEYLLIDPIVTADQHVFWFHKNYNRNRFFRADRAFLIAANAEPKKVARDLLDLSNDYDLKSWNADYLRDPMNTIWARLLISGRLKARELVTVMHQRDGQLRALSLAVMIKQKQIADEKIPAFITDTGPKYYNPFTTAPMLFDQEKRAISFENSPNNFTFVVRL